MKDIKVAIMGMGTIGSGVYKVIETEGAQIARNEGVNLSVKYVLANKDGEKTPMLCEQLYDLAKLAHGSLSPERMTKFIARSSEIMKEEYGA